jgi:hypothetical protein
MSLNRKMYDSASYQVALEDSTKPLDYMLFTGKYENCAKCRIELGTLGGNGVSMFSGNLVDLESNLRGQNPTFNAGSGNLVNQPSCQMNYYPRMPVQKPFKQQNACN